MFYFGDVFGSVFNYGDVFGSTIFIGVVYGLHKGVGYGMEIDLYKSRFLDGRPDGIWYKHKILRAGVSNCMCMCLIFLGTKHTHSFVPGLKGEAFFPDF
jgi:hypothetical protein